MVAPKKPSTRRHALMALLLGLVTCGVAQAESAITIYNGGFGVVRDMVPLHLRSGENHVTQSDVTAQVEPDSVILRDPEGVRPFCILEQNYRADPVSKGLLLSLYEGETIDFLVRGAEGERTVSGKVLRSGYTAPDPHQRASSVGVPMVKVDGEIRFGLPGEPLFPALKDDTILKPTLRWIIESPSDAAFDAELSYVTGGMRWEASYNLVAPESGNTLDIGGWVTMHNQTGKAFRNARVKLMAGDINRVRDDRRATSELADFDYRLGGNAGAPPPVTEKRFDEYHLYTLKSPVALLDRETKQVEFIRADGVSFRRFYVYDGARGAKYAPGASVQMGGDYIPQANSRVLTMFELENTKHNQLGLPLPKGRARFYRTNSDGQQEFIGENTIDHTPEKETIRIHLGAAFDIVGERSRTDFSVDRDRNTMEEAFEIKLRNRKRQAVEVRVVEHLYRWKTWQVVEHSNMFKTMDSDTIEFRVQVEPDEECTIAYRVQYTW
ncbi:MAG: DUF4139 domain-containing protein [bacterium]|nr:DUF4139 domain-containing protein [bacterium]